MITSASNEKLKLIRKLASRRDREREGLFAAEGEDLVAAAEAAGVGARFVLIAGEDVEPHLLDAVSTLGSGSRVIGVYERTWAELPTEASLSVYLEGVADPGNIGTIIRCAHALADGPVLLGPGCADPHSPKAVRASMGSIFARPPVRAALEGLGEDAHLVALDASAPVTLEDLAPPAGARVVLALGAERSGLSDAVAARADERARITIRPGGPDSLNVGMAAAIGLYELRNRMASQDDA